MRRSISHLSRYQQTQTLRISCITIKAVDKTSFLPVTQTVTCPVKRRRPENQSPSDACRDVGSDRTDRTGALITAAGTDGGGHDGLNPAR